jgi:hypothetical protein
MAFQGRRETGGDGEGDAAAVVCVVRLVFESPAMAAAVLRLLNHRRCADAASPLNAAGGGVLELHRQDTCGIRYAVSQVLSTANTAAGALMSAPPSCAQQVLYDEAVAAMAASHRATAMMRSN